MGENDVVALVAMDSGVEEQLDYGDEDYRGAEKMQYQGGGAIPALADEELMGEDDEYEDLYNDVNVGEGFLQMQCSETTGHSAAGGISSLQGQTSISEPRRDAGIAAGGSLAPVVDRFPNAVPSLPEQRRSYMAANGPEIGQMDGAFSAHRGTHDSAVGTVGYQGPSSMTPKPAFAAAENGKVANPGYGVAAVGQMMPSTQMATNGNNIVSRPLSNDNMIRPAMENGPTTLFVGELHWWTTDAELESVLSQYGRVKEIKFFDERASGKSKGYCQVDFHDPAAAAACKERMDGYVFNGRACVVTFASQQTLRQMGAAYMNKTQSQPPTQTQVRRNMNDGQGRGGGVNNYQGGDGGRNYGRGGWGRGGLGANNRGGGGGRGRGPMGAKGSVGNAAAVAGPNAGNYGQGLPGHAFGGPGVGIMHPQGMMGPGFDPSFMGRGGVYGGFSGPAFPGMMPPFPAVNPMGYAGVAPHVNPAFFGRGMTPNGMGMMGSNGMDGNFGGMWPDPSMGGWGGEEHGRTRESSYGGEDGASEHGHAEENPEKGARSNAAYREKERGSERDWPGNSERRPRDEREQDWERSDRERRYRDEKDGYRDNRQKERDTGYDDDRDRGQISARSRSRPRGAPEDDRRSRSRDLDYGKRRRAPSE
ncbi:Cleavage and polyadenylation specificity factor subunit 6-like protein [Drosera capensis]